MRPSVYVGAGRENASKGCAFGESSLSSGIGMERGIRQVPTEEIRQLKLENEEDQKNRLDQLLQQIKGTAVIIGDAPAETLAPAIRDSWDDSETQLLRELEALRSERERVLHQNKILKEIERNKGQLLAEIKALSNENEQLRQQNQNVEESNRAQQYTKLGQEEENGALITITPPVNSSNHLMWLQAVVPSLGGVLMNVGYWLGVTLNLLLSIVNLLPWRQILGKAHFLISLVYKAISSRYKRLKEKVYDVMVDITRAMVAQNAGRLVMHSA
ncbi:hypothetical protein MLD38_026112 [Melastoma candidum]|uniref:Uncharacterized protein n=1 Tax=Melastoma candidum TaxID=119954 RepID=A0ACB9NXK3_9MYRT|nr:hypothetical protein MLD38_026112 [Melastoma candidum]